MLWYCTVCFVFNIFLLSRQFFRHGKWMYSIAVPVAKCLCSKEVHLSSCINQCFQKILLFVSISLVESQLTLIFEFLRAKYIHLSSEVALSMVYCWKDFKYCVERKDWDFVVTVVEDKCHLFMILLCRILLCLAELNASTFVLFQCLIYFLPTRRISKGGTYTMERNLVFSHVILSPFYMFHMHKIDKDLF
jgi:hypothetical protein